MEAEKAITQSLPTAITELAQRFRALSVYIPSNVSRTKQPVLSNELNGGTAYLQAEFTVRQNKALILGRVEWSCGL